MSSRTRSSRTTASPAPPASQASAATPSLQSTSSSGKPCRREYTPPPPTATLGSSEEGEEPGGGADKATAGGGVSATAAGSPKNRIVKAGGTLVIERTILPVRFFYRVSIVYYMYSASMCDSFSTYCGPFTRRTLARASRTVLSCRAPRVRTVTTAQSSHGLLRTVACLQHSQARTARTHCRRKMLCKPRPWQQWGMGMRPVVWVTMAHLEVIRPPRSHPPPKARR